MVSRVLHVVLALHLAIISADSAKAQSADCLQTASHKIHLGQQVRITLGDGVLRSGRVIYFSENFASVMIQARDTSESTPYTIYGSEISSIQYKATGKLRPGWMMVGFGIGIVTGAIIYSQTDWGWVDPGGAAFVTITGMGGVLVGAIGSLCWPETRTLQCTP